MKGVYGVVGHLGVRISEFGERGLEVGVWEVGVRGEGV